MIRWTGEAGGKAREVDPNMEMKGTEAEGAEIEEETALSMLHHGLVH